MPTKKGIRVLSDTKKKDQSERTNASKTEQRWCHKEQTKYIHQQTDQVCNQKLVRADYLTATLTLAREGSTMPHRRRTDNPQKALIEIGVDFRLFLLSVVPILRIPFARLGPVLFVGIVTFVIDAGPLASWLTVGVVLVGVTIGRDIRVRQLAEEGWNTPMSIGHGSIVTTS